MTRNLLDWMRMAGNLSRLYARNPAEAARQYARHRHFIEVPGQDYDLVSLHRVMHGLKGQPLEGGPRSGQNIRKISAELSDLGYTRVTQTDPGFDALWQRYQALGRQCGSKAPSGGPNPPDTDRSFFVLTPGALENAPALAALAPQDAVMLGPGFEGAACQITTNRYERDPRLRDACIAHVLRQNNGRLPCKSCGFDFEAVFGLIGSGFVHVHHVHPLGNAQGEHEVDPTRHLIPLCPNCHAMAHRKRKKGAPPISSGSASAATNVGTRRARPTSRSSRREAQ